MENSTYITTVFSKLDLPETLLESLARYRSDIKPSQVVIPDILKPLITTQQKHIPPELWK